LVTRDDRIGIGSLADANGSDKSSSAHQRRCRVTYSYHLEIIPDSVQRIRKSAGDGRSRPAGLPPDVQINRRSISIRAQTAGRSEILLAS
jgi:hypothetical protein